MYLQRIEIQGFKSFADKAHLDFQTGITAVVGPNGSGKSNVADAIRWVLGEQSMKLLRSKKSEDVIFSGSSLKAQLGFAEVSLFLNNEDKSAPIDYTEVVITRRIYRNGEGEYFLNRGKVRLSDIQMLLARANMGQRTYSVIGQGMADSILVASPYERKEYLDEAAGVKEFEIKKNQSLNKLARTQDNLNQVNIQLVEIEPRLKSLTRQVKRLEQRQTLEEELNALMLAYYSGEWRDIDKKYIALSSEFRALEKDKGDKQQKVAKLSEVFAKAGESESQSVIFDSLQQEYEKFQGLKNELMEKQYAVKNQIEKQKIQQQTKVYSPLPVTKIISRLEYFGKLFEDILKTEETENLRDKIQSIIKDFNDFLSELRPSSTTAVPVKEADPALLKELNDIVEQLGKINNDLMKTQAKIQNLHREEEQKRRKLIDEQKELQRAQNELNMLTAKSQDIKIELTRLETRREDLEREVRENGGEEMRNNISRDDTKISVENIDLNNARFKIQNLKHQLDLIGGIDPETQKEYAEINERFTFLKTQFDDLTKARLDLLEVVKELDVLVEGKFNAAFEKINQNFQEYFKLLFDGGQAQLKQIVLETASDEDLEEESVAADDAQKNKNKDNKADPSRGVRDEAGEILEKCQKNKIGIEILATPPGKKLKSINVLSGGERALVSIALICAIISSNPAPFVVLDEMDAALDESNSIRFAKILEDLSHHTQFIVITHNRASMQKARILYGVTMGDDGASKLLSIHLEEAEKVILTKKS